MKRWILMIVCLSMLLCSGCSTTLMGNRDEIPYETFPELNWVTTPSLNCAYGNALRLRDRGAYEEAYRIFQSLSEQYPMAAKDASEFVWLKDTLIRTDRYTNGHLLETEKARYDSNGELIDAETRLFDDKTYAGDKHAPYIASERWLYDAHVVQTTLQAPYTLEFIYDSRGTVLSLTREPQIHDYIPGLAIWGYTVNYTYDAEGRAIRETGIDRLHHVSESWAYEVLELPFEAACTYDASGQLIRYDRTYTTVEGGKSWDTYTYDAAGNLILHESGKEGDVFFDPVIRYERIVREYRYDKNGNKLFESTLTLRGENAENAQQDYTQTEYLYENGHLMKEIETFSHTDTVNETVYTYGDYLIFASNIKKEETDDGAAASETGKSK